MDRVVKRRRWAVISAIFAISVVGSIPGFGAPPKEKSGPNLSITMTDSPDPVVVGNDLTYSIVAKNLGPAGANSVTVSDTLPASASFVSSQSSQGTCTGTSTVTCNLGKLAKNATATVSIVVRPTEKGTLSNTVSVQGDQSDPKPADNSATVTTTVNDPPPPPEPMADLAITMTDSPDPAAVGGELTYSITVTNNGPSQANSLMVTDTLPSSVELLSATANPGSCSGTTMVTCDLGTREVGWKSFVTIRVRPTQAGTVTNSASVIGAEDDPDMTDNSATAVTTIQSAETATADLTVRFNFPPSSASAGATVRYTVLVQNEGSATASRVKLLYPLPAGAFLVSSDVDSPNEGHCLGTSTLTCNVMDLAAGSSTRIRFAIKAELIGTISNSVTASTATEESSSSNNTAVASTQIEKPNPTEASDVVVTMADTPDPVVSRGVVTYAIDVINHGPKDSGPWTLGGSLPPSASPVSVHSSKGACQVFGTLDRSDPFGFLASPPIDVDGRGYSCGLGTLKNGDNAKVTLTLQLNRAGTIQVQAEAFQTCLISACLPARDPELRNNYGRVTTTATTLTGGADLWIGKDDHIVPWTEPHGTRHTFQTTVINGGGSTASSVILTERLPEGSVVLGVVASQGSCSGTATIVCNLGDLPAEGVAMVTIVVRPSKGVEGVNALVSEGSVSSGTTDPDPLNNRAVLARHYITRPICLPIPC